MPALSLVLVVGFAILFLTVSPKVVAWFGDGPRESLRAELDALERKKEMLRHLKNDVPERVTGVKQPPAA